MLRSHLLSAVVLSLFLCSCDSRKDFAGTYEVSGVLTLSRGSEQDKTELKALPLVIIADAFDSDRLYLDFDCGLSATMKDGESFMLDSKTCPSYTQDSCTVWWTFNGGPGSVEGESSLDFNPHGIIKVLCSDGSRGMLSFSFQLTGVRKSGSTPGPAGPGEQSRDTAARQLSELRAAAARALRPHLQ